MAVQNEGRKAFIANAAMGANLRVKLSSGSGTQVELAGAGEDFIGITEHSVDNALDHISVILKNQITTHKVVAAAAITEGAALYGAADGKVDDAASGTAIGKALEAATADNDVVEFLCHWVS